MLRDDVTFFPKKKKKKKKRQYGREPYKTVIEGKYKKHFSRMKEIKTIWV